MLQTLSAPPRYSLNVLHKSSEFILKAGVQDILLTRRRGSKIICLVILARYISNVKDYIKIIKINSTLYLVFHNFNKIDLISKGIYSKFFSLLSNNPKFRIVLRTPKKLSALKKKFKLKKKASNFRKVLRISKKFYELQKTLIISEISSEVSQVLQTTQKLFELQKNSRRFWKTFQAFRSLEKFFELQRKGLQSSRKFSELNRNFVNSREVHQLLKKSFWLQRRRCKTNLSGEKPAWFIARAFSKITSFVENPDWVGREVPWTQQMFFEL